MSPASVGKDVSCLVFVFNEDMEKAGLTREGAIRLFVRGARRDYYLYSILREEWKEPKILTRKASK